MTLENKSILAIDDTDTIRAFLRILLEGYKGAAFYEAATAHEGLNKSQEIKPYLIILDLGLPDKDGSEILPELSKIKLENGELPRIIVLTARKEGSLKRSLYDLGAEAYLPKPFLPLELLEIIDSRLN